MTASEKENWWQLGGVLESNFDQKKLSIFTKFYYVKYCCRLSQWGTYRPFSTLHSENHDPTTTLSFMNDTKGVLDSEEEHFERGRGLI